MIHNGRIVDPAAGRDEVADLWLEDGAVVEAGGTADETIDASGRVVAPGLVDLHTHLREPGREDEETVATASAAAAAGGYTAICAMPNTDPVADSAEVVERLWTLGRRIGLVDVVPSGALTRGQKGEEMADLGAMHQSGVTLFTDDGHGLQDELMARRIMQYLSGFGAIYAEHCEVESLARGGVMHEGAVSLELGLRGQPAAAEELMAARDIALCKLTGCRLHLLHISTAGTVELVRRAKADGWPVTAEATPHHFSLTDEELRNFDPVAKVNPPLRAAQDREAVIAGLADGTIDAIATDHAPHSPEEKELDMVNAPPGLLGLETALALTLTELVEPGHIDLTHAIRLLSTGPARILGLDEHGGPLTPGRPANVVVFDPDEQWRVDPAGFSSKARNTPFADRVVRGKVTHAFLRGRMTVKDGKVLQEVTL